MSTWSGLPRWLSANLSACNAGDLGWEDTLEKEKATHSSILARRIPGTEIPGGYSPWGCKRIGHA